MDVYEKSELRMEYIVHFYKPEIKDPDVCQPDLLIDSFHIYKNDEVAVSQAFDGLAAPLTEVFV